MIITLCSIFRDSEQTLPRYLKQVENLAKSIMDDQNALFCVWGEGDSTDNTRQLLENVDTFNNYRYDLIDVSHGGVEYGSVVDQTRFLQCAYAGNLVWSKVHPKSEITIWIDSDIIWDVETIKTLINLSKDSYAVCPLIILDRVNWEYNSFYNVFDFRINGEHFTHRQPYHKKLLDNDFVKVDSAGSCLVMRSHIARQVHFTAKEVIVGMCKQLNELSYSIYLDTTLKVYHE